MSDNIIYLNDNNFEKAILCKNKFLLIDFWAEWCNPCKMIAPFLVDIANEFNNKLTVAKFNIDQNSALIPKRYSIRSIPTLLLFYDGEVKDTKTGALSKAQMKEFLVKNM
ncbi:thioredoxin TrxA [Candidatus Curculioniphilus buchneri]|uniref:thioredoxin TrxA n=1 Tax=Candidatus Curculioniphilus buchneri TaxID=690594 RepID=UPI00376EBF4F